MANERNTKFTNRRIESGIFFVVIVTMGNSMPTAYDPNGAFNQSRMSTLGGRSTKSKRSDTARPESSRVLFLLYLIHRTWNIMVETVDLKNKRYVCNTCTTREYYMAFFVQMQLQLSRIQYNTQLRKPCVNVICSCLNVYYFNL